MKNPFILISKSGHEYVDSTCSLNRLSIDKLPVYGVEDSVEGKSVSQIFSKSLIISDIKENATLLGINTSAYSDVNLIFELIKKISQGNVTAIELVRKYGRRLGLIFLTLKTGELENRRAKKDWDERHWDYWKSIKRIIIVGGLSSGVIGAILKAEILSIFDIAEIQAYDFELFDNATNVGLMGCASQIGADNGDFVVFDFGQTNLKRGIVKKRRGEITSVTMLQSMPSKYMDVSYDVMDKMWDDALQLSSYILRCISETIKDAAKSFDIKDRIIISIANYVCDGKIYNVRGGYAKLGCLCSNYAEYLENELSSILRKKVSVKLIHDATAAALYFSDFKDTVCITAGTVLGVGFPEIRP